MSKPQSDAKNANTPVAGWLEALGREDGAELEKMAELWSNVADALPKAVTLLVAALKDPRPNVRAKLVRSLGAFGRQAREMLSPVRTALKRVSVWDEDESIRALAAETLVQAGESSRPPLADLTQALNDPHAPIRFSAAQALGERAAEAQCAVGLLLQKALRDPDGGVRLEAAVALYKIDGRKETILPMLIKALQDPDEVRRWIAADCLGEMGPAASAAVPALRQVLQQEFKSTLIRSSIALALEKIEGTKERAAE
jgi:HEAT repeat protein